VSGVPVLLLGVASEPPLRMVAERLDQLGVPHLLWDQRLASASTAEVRVEEGVATGALWIDDRGWALEDFGGVYNRLADVAAQPGLAGVPEDDPRRVRAESLVELLLTWCEVTPARVVNPLKAMASNASKPYQLALIAELFATPPTIVTTEPEAVLAFWEEHDRVVYKSTSGARSIVQELVDRDVDRLASVTRCPTQFQAYVPGIDVRVHTIANGCVFATVIDSDRVDYRYAHHEGGSASMHATSLDDELSARCLALAEQLDLAFAGIDLRITPDGEAYCLEVNPSPAYSAFEAETGQTISAGLAAYLAGLHGHG